MNAGGLLTRDKRRKSTTRFTRRSAVAGSLGILALVAAACGSGPTPAAQAKTLLAAGIAAEQSKSYSSAIDDFNQVLKDAPNDKTNDQYAYYNRGLCEQLETPPKNTAAEADYDKALAINPNFAAALYNLAILVTASSPIKAEDLYLQVIAIQPTNADAHLNLGFVYNSLGRRAAAIDQFVSAVHYKPSFVANVPATLKTAVNQKIVGGTVTGATGATGAATGATGVTATT